MSAAPGLPVLAALVLWTLPTAAAGGREAARADAEGFAMAACLTRQEHPFLREQGFLWSGAIVQGGRGDLGPWTALAEAVGAEAARRRMPMARGDGAVDDPLKPMPLLFCHELLRTPAVRAAIGRAARRQARFYR